MQDIHTRLEICLESQSCREQPSVAFTLQEPSSLQAGFFLPGSTTASGRYGSQAPYVSRQLRQAPGASVRSCTLLNAGCSRHLEAHLHQHPSQKGILFSSAGREEGLWQKAGILWAVPGLTLTYSCCQSCHLLRAGNTCYIISPVALTLRLGDSSGK